MQIKIGYAVGIESQTHIGVGPETQDTRLGSSRQHIHSRCLDRASDLGMAGDRADNTPTHARRLNDRKSI